MFPASLFGAGGLPFNMSSATSSDGKQSGGAFVIGDFNAGGKASKETIYLVAGIAFLAAFVYLARK